MSQKGGIHSFVCFFENTCCPTIPLVPLYPPLHIFYGREIGWYFFIANSKVSTCGNAVLKSGYSALFLRINRSNVAILPSQILPNVTPSPFLILNDDALLFIERNV